MDYNEIALSNGCEFLKRNFNKILGGILDWDSEGNPKYYSEVTAINAHEPTLSFNDCYNNSLSYEYTLDVDVAVKDADEKVIYTDTIYVRYPKFEKSGFIFKTSDRTIPKYRIPFIKANLSSTIYLYDKAGSAILILKGDEQALRVDLETDIAMVYEDRERIDYPISEFNWSDYPIAEVTAAKLSLLMGRPFGRVLNRTDYEAIKAFYHTDEGYEALKLKTPLDYSFDDITRTLEKGFNIHRAAQRSKSRAGWRRQGKLYASTIQTVINTVFSVGAWEGGLLTADETNSLTTLMERDKVYFMNGRGVKSRLDYNASFIGTICPVDTPETNLINKKNEKAIGSSFRNGEVYIKCYSKSFEELEIPLYKFYLSKVLISDCIDYDLKMTRGGVLTCKTGIMGDHIQVKSLEEVDYFESEPYNRLSYAVSLIPGVNETDQIKASIGAKMLGQTTTCQGSGRSIVYTGTEKDIFELSDSTIKTPMAGKVIEVTEKSVSIEGDSGEVVTVKASDPKRLYDNTVKSWKTNLAVGMKVQADSVVFYPKEFSRGEFAPYVNLNTAFMNWEGMDYLDGVILTAKSVLKCAIERQGQTEVVFNANDKYNFNLEHIKEYFDISSVEDSAFANLDSYGIVKIGSKIESGDLLYAFAKSKRVYNAVQELIFNANPTELSPINYQVPYGVVNGKVTAITLFVKVEYRNNADIIVLADHIKEVGGKVIYAATSGTSMAKLEIKYDYTDIPKVGDKFSNRWASKATISEIIPIEEIPYDEDGVEIECIIPPDTGWKRKNISAQVQEAQIGRLSVDLYNQVLGLQKDKKYSEIKDKLAIFYGNENYKKLTDEKVDEIIAQTSDIGAFRVKKTSMDHTWTSTKIAGVAHQLGLKEKRKIYMPGHGAWTRNEVLIGVSSMMRLHFIVQDKAKATSGMYSNDDHFVGGYGSSRDAGQKIGDMTTWALEAHNELALYDHLTGGVRAQFKDNFTSELAFIGLELGRTDDSDLDFDDDD